MVPPEYMCTEAVFVPFELRNILYYPCHDPRIVDSLVASGMITRFYLSLA